MIFIVCFLAVFALIAVIFGRNTAQNGLFLTLGITGAFVYSFVQALVWIGLIALAFLMPILGVPLLLITLVIKYVLPFAQAVGQSKKKSAVLDTEHEARSKRLYLAERKVEQLQQALAQAIDTDAISLCKQLSQDEGWTLALPILSNALSSPKIETRLCAAHGLRHIYCPQVAQKVFEASATFDAVALQHWHRINFKPELVLEVVETLGKCALNVQEDKRVRVAALIAIGNAAYVEAHGSVLALLGDKDNDVRAAACRALRQLMPPSPPVPSTQWMIDVPPTPQDWGRQIAEALYHVHFDALLAALAVHDERLQIEAIAAATAMTRFSTLSAADFDGLMRIVQNLSTDPTTGIKVHDAADEAIVTFRTAQRGQAGAHGNSNTYK